MGERKLSRLPKDVGEGGLIDGGLIERTNTSPAVAYTRLVGEVSSYYKIIVVAFPVPLGP